mgnify:CR=1 FL=1
MTKVALFFQGKYRIGQAKTILKKLKEEKENRNKKVEQKKTESKVKQFVKY